MPHETELEMAARHVREGERHVSRQINLIEQLRVDGHDTSQAEDLLVEFKAILAEHKAHLELIHAEQKSGAKT